MPLRQIPNFGQRARIEATEKMFRERFGLDANQARNLAIREASVYPRAGGFRRDFKAWLNRLPENREV